MFFKMNALSSLGPITSKRLTFGRQPGMPLPPELRARAEGLFGEDLSDVRVFISPSAPRMGAIAFTSGSEIHVAPGSYDPTTPEGVQLLGHELAHVVQQRRGLVRNPYGYGVAVVRDEGLEAEAERMGRALQRMQQKQKHKQKHQQMEEQEVQMDAPVPLHYLGIQNQQQLPQGVKWENRVNNAIWKHIFCGEVKDGKVTGYHWQNGNGQGVPGAVCVATGVPSGLDDNVYGVYQQDVEARQQQKELKLKKADASTFFPSHWTPGMVVLAINTARPGPQGKATMEVQVDYGFGMVLYWNQDSFYPARPEEQPEDLLPEYLRLGAEDDFQQNKK